jgi:hypothetical protein
MHSAADHTSVQSDNRSDGYSSIISSLGSLVEQVRANMELIESAIAGEASLGIQEAAADVAVLDDITPCYVKANAALSACNAGLGVVLHLLRDIGASKQEAEGAECQPVYFVRCA